MKFLLTPLFILYSFSVFAQVGIGTTDPNENSLLELDSTNKGFLPTRVNLTSTAIASPLAAHVQGMIVYNLASANDVTPGLYINTGTAWERILADTPVIKAAVYNTGSQVLPQGTPITAITFTNVDIDDGNYNSATSTYTVPVDGYYEISFSAKLSVNTGTSAYFFYLTIGGVNNEIAGKSPSPVALSYSAYIDPIMHTRVMELTAGTTIQPRVVVCNCALGPSYTIANARMSIQLLQK